MDTLDMSSTVEAQSKEDTSLQLVHEVRGWHCAGHHVHVDRGT